MTYQFNICDVLPCYGNGDYWQGYDITTFATCRYYNSPFKDTNSHNSTASGKSTYQQKQKRNDGERQQTPHITQKSLRNPNNISIPEKSHHATDYKDRNLWLHWIVATSRSLNMTNSVACLSAHSVLFTVPLPLYPDSDPANSSNCTDLSSLFPPVKNTTIPPLFTGAPGNYTCFSRNRGVNIGKFNSDWCTHNVDISSWSNATNMIWARADLVLWRCLSMVRVAMPLTLIGHLAQFFASHKNRQAAFEAFNFASETYIDAIGVPRRVPNQYKLVDPIFTGFENLPIISAIFPDATRDALAGLFEQLAATSLMTKKGACSMFGDQCFGKWKNVLMTVLLSVMGMFFALALCGCCCMPCMCSLCNPIIVAAIKRQDPIPPYQLPLMVTGTMSLAPTDDYESDQEHQI
uniref:Uncharacterized protein n=1 Tax=Cynoglossus semilaevis TaxID=244447 RepID=A0A3P8VX53_CYNSE